MSVLALATFVLKHLHAGVVDEPHFDELTHGRNDHKANHENRACVEPDVEAPADSEKDGDGEGHFHALTQALIDIARTIALGQSTRKATRDSSRTSFGGRRRRS